jgi:soluble cytochrome b562
MTRYTVSRFFALFTILWCLMLLMGCTTSWVSEATSIIQLLVPAITSVLSILTAFGVPTGLTTTALASIQSWANQATAGLQTVANLINQYNTAKASAQPGILTEIQTAISTITNNLATILPELHVTDADTQAKITAVIKAVQSELVALLNLVPALKGEVKSHDELKALVAAVQSPKEFRASFNKAAGVFGKEYEI